MGDPTVAYYLKILYKQNELKNDFFYKRAKHATIWSYEQMHPFILQQEIPFVSLILWPEGTLMTTPPYQQNVG